MNNESFLAKKQLGRNNVIDNYSNQREIEKGTIINSTKIK